jgi:hypothetical protein
VTRFESLCVAENLRGYDELLFFLLPPTANMNRYAFGNAYQLDTFGYIARIASDGQRTCFTVAIRNLSFLENGYHF